MFVGFFFANFKISFKVLLCYAVFVDFCTDFDEIFAEFAPFWLFRPGGALQQAGSLHLQLRLYVVLGGPGPRALPSQSSDSLFFDFVDFPAACLRAAAWGNRLRGWASEPGEYAPLSPVVSDGQIFLR